jgi:membrane-bound lytic murein transglycosylase B
MSAKHGFDRGYLNYLFSNTKSTPFLARMAYADGHPKRRVNKKPRAGRWTRYRGNFLTPRTINKGIAFARANRVALQRAEDRYGVPKEYILGIIGVETRYGENVGKNRAIDALSAMGFENARRGKYFQSELEAFLVMSRKEGLDPLRPMASYAGALGLCQFMPSNIKRYAVDHDRSGTVNLWTPHDAIGSVANYFKKHGWRTGGTVAVRANSSNSRYKSLKTGYKSSHSLSRLKSKGVSARNLGNISGKASLLKLNTYGADELWLGGHNFYVITRYNHSTHYAMAVHQLGQAIKARLGGRGAVRQASNGVDLHDDELALLMK